MKSLEDENFILLLESDEKFDKIYNTLHFVFEKNPLSEEIRRKICCEETKSNFLLPL